MTPYKVQYWLYAILNKKYGKKVEITRDRLHSRYEVNRHGIYISSESIDIQEIHNWLKQTLISCCYKEDKSYPSMPNYIKHIEHKKFVISMHTEAPNHKNEEKIYANVFNYKG